MFHPVKNPPQWLLDGLMSEEKPIPNCPDCGVEIGKNHLDNCDVARCDKTGSQRLACDCGKCGDEKWMGFWPGIKECYDNKFVCFDDISRTLMFDLNQRKNGV